MDSNELLDVLEREREREICRRPATTEQVLVEIWSPVMTAILSVSIISLNNVPLFGVRLHSIYRVYGIHSLTLARPRQRCPGVDVYGQGR